MRRIPRDIVTRIKEAARLEDIIGTHVELRRSGTSKVGPCPKCDGKKSFNFAPAKQLVKCFKCDTSAKDGVGFLTNFLDYDFLDALKQLADRYSIDIPSDSSSENDQMSFRDQQLQASGISLTSDRYVSGSVTDGFERVEGDDMILIYLDLDGEAITFDRRKKKQPYFRVRFRNPAHHPDKKTGKPTRYKSPYGSQSQLWIPDVIISDLGQSAELDTLVICEGEKKATKLCQVGIKAVGISGIHNFDPGKMTLVFERLIRVCRIKNVVFLLDNDWDRISIHKHQSVDARPRSFASAVSKFRDYFYGYTNEDIYLSIYFGYHPSSVHKGIDDYLSRKLQGKEKDLLASLTHAIDARDGISKHVQLHKITQMHEYKIREYWHLNNAQDFLNHHKKDLKSIDGVFKQGRIEKRWNAESKEFEIAQAVMPTEEYWRWEELRGGKLVSRMNHTGARNFLKSRGFYKVRILGQPMRFVKVEDKVIAEVDETDIRDYAIEFTESINKPEILEMILASDRAFMNTKLKDMYAVDFTPIGREKEAQTFIFNNKIVRVTSDKIEMLPKASMGGYVWKDEVIDFNIDFEKPLLEMKEVDGALVFESDDPKRLMSSQIFRFVVNTSNFYWRQEYQMVNGKCVRKKKPVKPTDDQNALHMQHITAKMIAIGYILHNYEDLSQTKAIICMDGIESEVGRNEGGTGKSVFATMFENIMSTFVIDANSKKLTDDSFLFDGVDERTRALVFDDCRVNIDFGFFFSKITRGIWTNPKGSKKFFAGLKKLIFTTNHAIGGSDNSTLRRQYVVAFSDYYGQHRTPFDDFGCVLFKEWNIDQWNLLFNFFFCCVQGYLKFGFSHGIPGEAVTNRKLRQLMGDDFLEWAFDTFGNVNDPNPDHVNKRISRKYCEDDFKGKYSRSARYVQGKYFKDRMFLFCQYAGFSYNQKGDKSHRIRSANIEYFVVADQHCPENPPDAFEYTDSYNAYPS